MKLVALCKYKWVALLLQSKKNAMVEKDNIRFFSLTIKSLDPVKHQGFSWGVYEEPDEG